MRNLIAAAAACLALSANAGDHDQMVWHGSGGSVYLLQEACAIPALAELLKDAGAKAIRGTAQWKCLRAGACSRTRGS